MHKITEAKNLSLKISRKNFMGNFLEFFGNFFRRLKQTAVYDIGYAVFRAFLWQILHLFLSSVSFLSYIIFSW